MFEGLSVSELEILETHSEYRRCEGGSIIVENSSLAGSVFIVEDGDVVISRDGHVLARFIGGEIFGELDLFSTGAEPATVRTDLGAGFLVFPAKGKNAGAIFSQHPQIASKILKNLLSIVAKRIRSTNKLLSQRSPWVQELKRQVFVDKLTGLNNRTWLTEEATKELAGRRSGTAVLVIKPDNFKTINDTYGHDAGDQTLELLGAEVRHMAKGRGIPARHGGDVFAVIFNNANQKQIRSFSNLVIRHVKSLDFSSIVGGDDFTMTASVGVAIRERGANKPLSEVVQTAFDRMLAARESGGDRAQFADGADG